jgi:hypothetical protein
VGEESGESLSTFSQGAQRNMSCHPTASHGPGVAAPSWDSGPQNQGAQ